MKNKLVMILTLVLLLAPVYVAKGADTTDHLNAAAGKTGAGYVTTSSLSITDRSALMIRVVLGLVGIVFLVLTIYAGIMWMTAGGNDDQLDKAKKTLTRSVIGLIIITSSYSISLFAERLAKGDTNQGRTCIDPGGGLPPCCEDDPCWDNPTYFYQDPTLRQ